MSKNVLRLTKFFVVPYLAVLAVHVRVVDAELLPGLPHLEPLPQSHEYGANSCSPHTRDRFFK